MSHSKNETFKPARVAVITVSDTRTLETDTSGQTICDFLQEAGHIIAARHLVTDEVSAIQGLVKTILNGGTSEFIILTGGTGLTHRDVTPEAIDPFISKAIPGFGELFRMLSYEEIGTSTIQSRALAGLAKNVVLFALPGSTGACRLAMSRIILPQIDNTHRPCNFRSIVGS